MKVFNIDCYWIIASYVYKCKYIYIQQYIVIYVKKKCMYVLRCRYKRLKPLNLFWKMHASSFAGINSYIVGCVYEIFFKFNLDRQLY